MKESPDVILSREAEVVESARGPRLAYDLLLPLASLGVVLGIWWSAVSLFSIPRYVVPSPGAVFSEMVDARSKLLSDAIASGKIAAIALVISLVIGVPVGLALARWRLARRIFMPPIVAIQSIPKVALAPLLVAWLGFGVAPKLVVTILITFFPLTLATMVGVESVTRSTIDLARSMGCSFLKFLTYILFPSAAPYIAAAFKTSATLAIVGVLVAEFVGSEDGLGNLLLIAAGNRDSTLAFAAILTVAGLGVIFYTGAAILARVATIRLGNHYMRSVT
jgi:NitT/TauT family transport system permease protein